MKSIPVPVEFSEPERYELREGSKYSFELSRREFLGVLGAGIVISVAAPVVFAQRPGGPRSLAERLHISEEGRITVMTSKVEVGQGSRTQLLQAAAEELRVPLAQLELIMADSDLVPDDGGTAGSRTTPSTVPAVRKACAAARELLLSTAARAFSVDPGKLTVRGGTVHGLGDGHQYGYAELAKAGDALAAAPAESQVTEVQEWSVLGTSTPHVNARAIVTGTHRYPSDIVRPGMLHGKVLRAPGYGAELASIDLERAEALPGVVVVRDGAFVGCAAPTSFAAARALELASEGARWTEAAHPSSDELYAHLRAKVTVGRSREDVRGEPDQELARGRKVLRETYHVPYIQHAPMEPRAAVAEWDDGRLTVWTGTQQPARVHQELTRAFRLSNSQVRVIVPDTGGGFGGKHTGEVAVEAARLALAAKKPVSLRWTREEEFTWAYFRPAGVIDMAGALDDTGALSAWEHINVNSGASSIAMPYATPNVRTEFRYSNSPLREGSYRALAATANTFAREGFMDELAVAAGADPLEFRLRHLRNDRLRAVMEAAAKEFGWDQARKNRGARTGVGLACGTEKGSYVACCVRVEADADGNGFRVTDVCEAFECGAVQNPANLRAQVEGCVIQGLGAALTEEIRFQQGRILNPRFSEYRVPRLADVPAIRILLLDRTDLPSVGGGETPIIAVAPAIANALFHATTRRIRSMPLRLG